MADIIAYLDERLGRGHATGREREYHCFACIDRVGSESSKRKLRVNVVKGVAHCHRCGYSAGSFDRILRDMNNGRLTITEMAMLRQEGRPPAEGVVAAVRSRLAKQVLPEDVVRNPVPLPDSCLSVLGLTAGQSSWSTAPKVAGGVAYLRKRGVPVEVAARFDVRYCYGGRYAGYLVFPVRMYGVPVYWTNRYAGDRPWTTPEDQFKKTWNVPHEDGDYGKSDVLLNYDNVVGQPLVSIVEGPHDCMAMPHAVALLGKLASDRQLRLLAELVKTGTQEFLIAGDPDAVRECDALRAKLLDIAPRVSVLQLDYGDPSSRQAEIPDLIAARVAVRPLGDRIRLRLWGKK